MSLKEYFLPMWRKWWLILAAVTVSTAGSYFAQQAQPPVYQARTTLIVGQALLSLNPNNTDLYLTQQLANAYADVVKRPRVQVAVKQALNLTTLPEYTVRVVPATQLMEIAVTDTSAERAQAVANELANQLVRLSPSGLAQTEQSRQSFVNQQLDELEASIKSTRDEIGKKQADLANTFSARQISDSQYQISALQSKLSALQSNYAALLQETQRGATNTISIFDPASLPTDPIGPNRLLYIALAAAIGFVLAVSGAYLSEYLDDTLKTPDAVQKALNLVTLGTVSSLKGMQDARGLRLEAPIIAREAYNILRTNLQFAAIGRPLNMLLVTSAAAEEGKSLTSANLSAALAQAGQKVILVDGDLRRPQVHRLFGLSNNVGLTSALLQSQPDLDVLLQETKVPGLRVMVAGPLPPNPAALLSSQPMHDLLRALRAEADIVILDSPPATAFADAAILGAQADGVLLVVAAGHTRRERVLRALSALNQVHASVLGVLLNRMPGHSSDYYYYYRYRYQPHADSTTGASSARQPAGTAVPVGQTQGVPVKSQTK